MEDKPLLKITETRFLNGPNLHADQSALVATLEGDEGLAVLAQPIPPGLGRMAGCERLAGGAQCAELIASARADLPDGANGLALALALAARVQSDHVMVPARGRVLDDGGGSVKLLVPGDTGPAAQHAARLGVTLALAVYGAKGRKGIEWVIGRCGKLLEAIVGQALDMSTLAVARKAIENDIPVYRVSPALAIVQLGQGVHLRLVGETVPDPQSYHAVRIARDKWTTVQRLLAFGLPALRSRRVFDAQSAIAAAREMARPVVVKPASGGKGQGISLNLNNEKQVRDAFAIAARYGRDVLVEAFAPGDDHRLTVVDGRMIAAARRVAATVTGDGMHTVRELIEALNTDPRRGIGYQKLMVKVPIDARLETLLGQQSLHLDAVPEAGRVVQCSLAANISQGGTAVDVTDLVHPDNRMVAELAARSCHALVAGVDFMTTDISKSWREGVGWVLEVNTSPGLRPHWIANPAQDVVTPILRVAFPEGAPARVPTAGITGSVGKSTTCQMLAHIARTAGRHPGVSTTQGTWSGDTRLKYNDWAGGTSAVDLLSDPLVDISIAELARGGLLKKGMVLDAVDVAAVLNLTSNHVGIDGIETREDLARIKAIPVRRAREWVFLNADEPLVLAMREVMAPGVKLGLVSPMPKSPALVAHRKAGGCTVTLEGKGKAARIVVRQGETVEFEIKVAAIPASNGGTSAAIAENAMFAAAVALRLGIDGEHVAAGLSGFKSDFGQNPGRHNVVEGLPFDVLLTWADGPEPIDELVDYLAQHPHPGPRHLYLIGPGNRSDEWIAQTGKHAAAGKFDRYWAADMADLRGREPGDVPDLLAQGLVEGGADPAAITRLPGDARVLTPVLEQIEPGAHLTVMAFDTLALLREIEAFRDRADPTWNDL